MGRVGAVRFNAWICGFSSTANTAAATDGFMERATREAGGVGATLTTLQKVATALDLKIVVELPAAT